MGPEILPQGKVKVLVFPCGAEIAMEIHAALKQKVHVEIWGGSSRVDHGRLVFANYLDGLPYIDSPDFLPVFNNHLLNHSIDFIFPAHDTVALFFAVNRNKIHAQVLTAEPNTCRICREKKAIYALFKDYAFCPDVYEDILKINDYPVFAKPNIGQGGKNCHIIHSESELRQKDLHKRDYVITEFLPGNELSVDCFTDRHGVLRFVGPRTRNRVLAGISVDSSSIPLLPEISEIAGVINAKLKFQGAWFFQIKEKNGAYKLLEVASRIASTMCVYRALGINFPLLTIYDALGIDVSFHSNEYTARVDRAFINRYQINTVYEYVYLDFDDTLVVDGMVNALLMMFLYQCRAKKKKVILLSSHAGSLDEALSNHSIPQSLFFKIYHLPSEVRKAEKVLHLNSIFIDNSFYERNSMVKEKGIPVFDTDAIECLLDWRL